LKDAGQKCFRLIRQIFNAEARLGLHVFESLVEFGSSLELPDIMRDRFWATFCFNIDEVFDEVGGFSLSRGIANQLFDIKFSFSGGRWRRIWHF
jgi:hypothetical protein